MDLTGRIEKGDWISCQGDADGYLNLHHYRPKLAEAGLIGGCKKGPGKRLSCLSPDGKSEAVVPFDGKVAHGYKDLI